MLLAFEPWFTENTTVYDGLAGTDGEDGFKAWLSKLYDAMHEVVAFVASRRQGRLAGEFHGCFKG
jgi:hypothetical protein